MRISDWSSDRVLFRSFELRDIDPAVAPYIADARPIGGGPRRRSPGALGEREQTREEHIIDLPVGAERLAPQLRPKSRDAMPRLQDRLVLARHTLGKKDRKCDGVGKRGYTSYDLGGYRISYKKKYI